MLSTFNALPLLIYYFLDPYNKKPFSREYYELADQVAKLPVVASQNQFLELLDKNKAIVVIGETGSGKSTQIPKWCVQAAYDTG